MQAGIGFSTHSGWAVAITAGLDDTGQLSVLDRRRVELIDADLPRQAYHAAESLEPAEAEALVTRVEASITACSTSVVEAISRSRPTSTIRGIGVIGRPRKIPPVAVVLASHARMHACEGELYRRGLVEAANELGLPVTRLDAADLIGIVGQALGWSADRIQQELTSAKKSLGPPWRADHKQAALAALATLRFEPSWSVTEMLGLMFAAPPRRDRRAVVPSRGVRAGMPAAGWVGHFS